MAQLQRHAGGAARAARHGRANVGDVAQRRAREHEPPVDDFRRDALVDVVASVRTRMRDEARDLGDGEPAPLPAREARRRHRRADPSPHDATPPGPLTRRHRGEQSRSRGIVEDEHFDLDAVDQLPRRPRARLRIDHTERDVEAADLLDDVAEQQRAGRREARRAACSRRASRVLRRAGRGRARPPRPHARGRRPNQPSTRSVSPVPVMPTRTSTAAGRSVPSGPCAS